MHDVHDPALRFAVLLQQRSDGFARGSGVGNFELALSVFVLGVDDDEGAVAGGGGGGLDADDLEEGLDGHCCGLECTGCDFGVCMMYRCL